MKTLKLKFIGVRPIVMQSAKSMDLQSELARARYDLNARAKEARKKPDNFPELVEIQKESMYLDWQAGIYHDEEGFYIPSECITRTIESGAPTAKARKEITTQTIITEDRIRIGDIPNYDTLVQYYQDPQFRLPTTIRVPPKTGARNMTHKPMIPTGWTLTFTIEHQDSVASARIVTAAINGGCTVGLCGWRPKFGRFKVEQLEPRP